MLISKYNFKIFSKCPTEMNSMQPFYPILIPNTPYVKKENTQVRRGSQKSFKNLIISKNISTRVCKKTFLFKAKNKKKNFVLVVPKVL